MEQAIAAVRTFNRFYTRRVGALNARFLGTELTLPEARLLFEVGVDGADIRTLRERLDAANRYAVLYRVATAKREDTRRRRVEQFVAMLARGETIHPARGRPGRGPS